MKSANIYLIIIGVILTSIIFAADFVFQLGAISLFYILFLLASFWLSPKRYHIMGSSIVSSILIVVGWTFQTHKTEILIDTLGIKATLNYETLFRVVSLIIIMFCTAILMRDKTKQAELQKNRETLELRVLARTAASEYRAKRLEHQIKILQNIRNDNVKEVVSELDVVITELKKLSNQELKEEEL